MLVMGDTTLDGKFVLSCQTQYAVKLGNLFRRFSSSSIMCGDIYVSFRARMLMNFGLICCFLNQVPAGLVMPTSVAMFLFHLSPEAHDFFSPL